MTETTLKLQQESLSDGWEMARETWTYASASTITVPSGAASKYQKGDRIKWTQTTVKYGVIVSVADTLLTIAVNTDYVVTNAAISANYYSHQVNPIGCPATFNTAAVTFNVTYLDNGSGGQISSSSSRYTIIGSQLHHFVGVGASTKAGNNNLVQFTIPATMPTKVDGGQGYGVYGSINIPFNVTADGYCMTAASIADNASIAGGFNFITTWTF